MKQCVNNNFCPVFYVFNIVHEWVSEILFCPFYMLCNKLINKYLKAIKFQDKYNTLGCFLQMAFHMKQQYNFLHIICNTVVGGVLLLWNAIPNLPRLYSNPNPILNFKAEFNTESKVFCQDIPFVKVIFCASSLFVFTIMLLTDCIYTLYGSNSSPSHRIIKWGIDVCHTFWLFVFSN